MKQILFGLALSLAIPVLALTAAPFSFDLLREEARKIAAEPATGPQEQVHEFWRNLGYDQHRDIRFKSDRGLWAKQRLPFSIDFFHPSVTAKSVVSLYEVAGGEAHPLRFDPNTFHYGKLAVPEGVPPPPGYAGWRARSYLNSRDYMDEFLVFLGASYFRAVPAHSHYGLSARGLSINSGLPEVPEEFPSFRTFYLQKPANAARSLTAWALIEGESVAGAYQFVTTPGQETVMDVEAEITLRRPVQQLGLAPFSSMFWYGEATHPRPEDFRPEVHDSDGLLMALENGSFHFRPLEHTRNRIRHCVFTLERPRSWSLLQRDRSFSSYQDLEADYHDRPSVRVEPLEGFGHGKLHLIELPTPDEASDNVVLLWEPLPGPEPGTPLRFRYRLHWTTGSEPHHLFQVRATRMGLPMQKANQLLVAVDFAKPLCAVPRAGDSKWEDISGWNPAVGLNSPEAKLLHVGLTDLSMAHADELPAGLGRSPALHMPQVLRAFFVLELPPGLKQIDLTCELRDALGQVLSERWVYLWMLPG